MIQNCSHSKCSGMNCKGCSSVPAAPPLRDANSTGGTKLKLPVGQGCSVTALPLKRLAGLSRTIRQISLNSLMIHANLGPVLPRGLAACRARDLGTERTLPLRSEPGRAARTLPSTRAAARTPGCDRSELRLHPETPTALQDPCYQRPAAGKMSPTL